jgi:hypothetical protein
MPLLVHERDAYRTVTEGIAAWRKFFAICAESELLTGKAKAQPGMPPSLQTSIFCLPRRNSRSVSTISSYWRKPDHTFHPYEYTAFELNDNYAKKTCLWTGGGFVMPEKQTNRYLGEPDNRIHAAPPSDDRADFRSATPMGFARAVFAAIEKQEAAMFAAV